MCGNSFWVEVITLLYHVSYALVEPSIKVHIYESVCQVGNFTNCDLLTEVKELEDAVHEKAAIYIVYLKLLRMLPSLIIILFCGAWSDDIGRKLPLLFPFVGLLISLIVYLLSYIPALNTLSTVLVGGLLSGLFGEVGLILMAGYSYVTDVTESTDRTRRLGRLMAMSFFGQFLGSFIVAIMMKFTEARNVFILALVLTGLSIVVIITFLQDSLMGKQSPNYLLCRPSYLIDTWQVITAQRAKKKRKYIIMILISVAIHQACLSGELDVAMLFTRHRPLNWKSNQYGYYLTGGFLCSGLGTLILLPILTHFFKINDFALAMAAVGFKVVHMSWMSFAFEAWMVYSGLPLMVVSAMLIPALKSLVSKMINDDEIGKIFGVSAFGEALSTVAGTLLFTAVYGASVQLFQGLPFLLEAIVNVGVFVCLLWLSQDYQKHHHTLVVTKDDETKPDGAHDIEEATPSLENPIETTDKENYQAISHGYDQPKPMPAERQLSAVSQASTTNYSEDSDESEYGPSNHPRRGSAHSAEVDPQDQSYKY